MTDSPNKETKFAYEHFTGKGPPGIARNYVIGEVEAKIVDFAIQLGRPLLVEGEAGCGKTRLADAITAELQLEPTIVANVRSTSRASDLLYRFDAIRRLQDSQMTQADIAAKAAYAHNYVNLQPLGRAILEGGRRVVLIDEIDKGDMDYPNDLLHVLDKFEFYIDEIPPSEDEQAIKDVGHGHKVGGTGVRPIVIFTSNREKQLSKPFLRRCLYLELTFPSDPVLLEEIVVSNLNARRSDQGGRSRLGELSTEIIRTAVRSFLRIRKQAEENRALKLPATAELIDWLHILHWEKPDVSTIDTIAPPYWQILFSTSRDLEAQARTIKTATQLNS